jgi:hypothetical protein
VATDICQYCGVELDVVPPRLEQGWAYEISCSACPPERRRLLLLARSQRVAALTCPDCGARIAPAGEHPDVRVVKELTYEVCAACGERCGVAAVRMVRDLSG